MKVLVVDVEGTHVKILATGHRAKRELPSGPTLTAERRLARVKQLAHGLDVRRRDHGLRGTGPK